MIRKRRKKSKNYFTKETEDWIVVYNNTCSKHIQIYFEQLQYTMEKQTI